MTKRSFQHDGTISPRLPIGFREVRTAECVTGEKWDGKTVIRFRALLSVTCPLRQEHADDHRQRVVRPRYRRLFLHAGQCRATQPQQ